MQIYSKGSTVIEVLISLSLAAFLIAVLGNLISSTRRLETSQNFKQRALAYARESLETVTSLQNELFACVSAVPGPGTCSNAQGSCILAAAYNSCWLDLNTTGPFHLEEIAGNWQLASGGEIVPGDADFSRSLIIINMNRDADGHLVTSGGTPDPNTKQVTVQLSWQERGQAKNFFLSTMLTAWANVHP